ncbi:hypothetical protein B5M09_011129, partial [Aphanomyces astaci]
MSYVWPTRAPIHRTYGEKQDLLRAWNAVEGGGTTLVAFCRSQQIPLSTFEKWLTIQDRINQVSADRVNKHIAPQASVLHQRSKTPVDPRRLQLHAWMAAARSPINLERMRDKVSEIWPEWDDISHPEFKHSNYFAKWCRRVAARFEARRQAKNAASNGTVSDSESNGVDAPVNPKGPAARRGTTQLPAGPAPANPKGPAARSDTTQLPDTPAPATQPGNTDEPAPRAPRNPHNIVHPRLANPAVSPPSPTTNEGAFDSDFKDIFGVATASATHSIPLPLKRGATTPPAKSKPDKAPRKVHDAANVIVLTESDDSGDDIKFESVEADPETLGRLYSHIETCQPGFSLPPRLARSSRGKRFSSGVHNTHCGRCSREFPCNSFRLCDNLMTQTECAPNRCSSMEFCQNQTIRKKRFPKTTVVEDVLLKHVLRIDVDVRSETKIIEYVGEYMSKMDFLRRKRLKQ